MRIAAEDVKKLVEMSSKDKKELIEELANTQLEKIYRKIESNAIMGIKYYVFEYNLGMLDPEGRVYFWEVIIKSLKGLSFEISFLSEMWKLMISW